MGIKSNMRGVWRFMQPFKNYPVKYFFKISASYIPFIKDWNFYRRQGGSAPITFISPVFNVEKMDAQSGGGHYFYQDIWALRHLAKARPKVHHDIGSRFDGFTGQATAICPVVCVDIRMPSFKLPDFHFVKGDILQLPFEDGSLASLSCLHTIEHIGLGRYGDPINPNGYDRALSELERVISPGGFLLLSMPVGKERVEFNAQRILDPLNCIERLRRMELMEFSIVNDNNEFCENVKPHTYKESKYSCGLYLFIKKK